MARKRKAKRLATPYSELLPPLSTTEFAALKADIKVNGVRDAVLIDEDGNILDGHNRYAIDKNAPTRVIKGLSDGEKEAFVFRANFNRRNLSVEQKQVAREKMKATAESLREEDKRKWTQKRVAEVLGVAQKTVSDWFTSNIGGDNTGKPSPDARIKLPTDAKEVVVARIESGETQEQVAADFGVCQQTISNVVGKAKQKEQQANKETPPLPDGVYNVVVMDPPWAMEKILRDCRPNQVEMDYRTMTQEELLGLDIPAADDCHMWMWTTHRFLPDALALIEAWGFRYVCTFVWHKPGGYQPVGLPQYNCEFAVYARKGTPKFVDTKAFNVCFDAPRGKHSEKPEEFYDVVRRVTDGERVDMFNRRRIEGFDGWGNESDG